MKNIFISLISNKLVFKGDFPESNEIIKEWEFKSNTVTRANLEKLCNESVVIKVGWSTSDIECLTNSIRLTLKPIFFVDSLAQQLNSEEQDLLRGIIDDVNLFVEEHKLTKSTQSPEIVEIDRNSEMITYREPGQSSSREFNKFIEKLEGKSIRYQIEYKHSQAVEQGASGGFFEAIIFIQSTIASGVVYDLIKGVPAKYLPQVKKERTDTLKSKIAHELRTQPENLEMTSYKVEEDFTTLDVYFNRNKYQCQFDKKNELVKFNKVPA
jgi:hypothetical protein